MAEPVTSYVAWYAAILSTVVFVWDVIKWKLAGPKLRLSVTSNMNSFNIPEYEGHTLIIAVVVNYGDRPTTITHVVFSSHPNVWSRLIDRGRHFVLANPNLRFPIPHELKPGAQWDAIAFQDRTVASMGTDKYLVCSLYHTHRKRPVRKRVIIKPARVEEKKNSK